MAKDKNKSKVSELDLTIMEWEQKLADAKALKNDQAVVSIQRIIDFYKKKRGK